VHHLAPAEFGLDDFLPVPLCGKRYFVFPACHSEAPLICDDFDATYSERIDDRRWSTANVGRWSGAVGGEEQPKSNAGTPD
jgi:hypothetical protein